MTDLEDLARTPDLVASTVDALGLSEGFETRAAAMAKRAELEHPVNRAPSTLAAGAVYLVGLLEGPRFSQHEVADAAEVSAVAVRNCYPDIAAAEGIELVRKRGSPPTQEADR